MSEKKIELGQTAQILQAAVAEFIQTQQRAAITRIVADYRGKTLSASDLYGYAGTFSTLESLESELKKRIREGNRAKKEDIGG